MSSKNESKQSFWDSETCQNFLFKENVRNVKSKVKSIRLLKNVKSKVKYIRIIKNLKTI